MTSRVDNKIWPVGQLHQLVYVHVQLYLGRPVWVARVSSVRQLNLIRQNDKLDIIICKVLSKAILKRDNYDENGNNTSYGYVPW